MASDQLPIVDESDSDLDENVCVSCGEESDDLWVIPGEQGERPRCRDCETERLGRDPGEVLRARSPSREEGCCTECGGSGHSGDEDTAGRCWTCRGTGHPHDGPCVPAGGSEGGESK